MVAERKDDQLGGRGEVGCLAWVVSQLRRDKGGREDERARGESFACERDVALRATIPSKLALTGAASEPFVRCDVDEE